MPTYRFNYELHKNIIAKNKKDATKQARALMRQRVKAGAWISAKIKKISDAPKYPRKRKAK